MADNVSIEFSAQIGQLISAVDKVKEAISSKSPRTFQSANTP
jgi:hypothetical protein